MTQAEGLQGLVVYCDLQGQISEVVRDDFGTRTRAAIGRAWALAVDPASFRTALSFMAALQARGAAFGWVLDVPAKEEPILLHFAGAIMGERLLIMAARTVPALRGLSAEVLQGGNEDTSAAWRSIQACSDAGPAGAISDEAVLNEFTRLSNDLARLQRELAKQNAELQALNRLVQDRADKLELRVEERNVEPSVSRARFTTMLETAGMGIALIDTQGRMAEANVALQEMLRATEGVLQGAVFADQFYNPDGRTALAGLHEEMMSGSRDHYRIEGYCTHRDDELAWVNMTVAALKGQGPVPDGAVAVVEDITDKRQTQAAMIHAERLTLAGKLAASLAHEINNPLQSIIGCVALAEEELAAGEDPAEYLALARNELRRVASMVGRMRELHRKPRAEIRYPTDVNGLLEQVLTLSKRQCKERGVHVSRSLDPTAPPLGVVADQMRQVFLNMILNAIEAMPDGGQLVVRSERTSNPEGLHGTFADGGNGIPPEVLPHIFKAFYSTKPGGTGIGLAITQDIVMQHGGQQVETEVGTGTKFSIWLPAAVQDA